jgi:hypothetical protein
MLCFLARLFGHKSGFLEDGRSCSTAHQSRHVNNVFRQAPQIISDVLRHKVQVKPKTERPSSVHGALSLKTFI